MDLPELDENRTLIEEERRIIARVYIFLEKEYNYLRSLNPKGDLTPLADIRQRTAEATGVSKERVTECLEEFGAELQDAVVYNPNKKWRHPIKKEEDDADVIVMM